jgi:hypothetical protein
MKAKEEINYIIDVTCEAFNVNKAELLTKSRKMELAIPRIISAVVGIKEANIKKDTVAEALKRDRTGMYYYLKMHKDYFATHKPYMRGYMKVLKAYKKIDEDCKEFIYKREFNLFIKKMKFKNAKKPDIVITVTCGKYSNSFYSDCFNFTEDIEIIKLAFKDYKHKINYNSYEE